MQECDVQFQCSKDKVDSIHDLFYSRMDEFPFLVTDWRQDIEPDGESVWVWIHVRFIKDEHIAFLKALLIKRGAAYVEADYYD